MVGVLKLIGHSEFILGVSFSIHCTTVYSVDFLEPEYPRTIFGMSDLDKNAPSEGNRGTLEDLMEAAIADAENEKVVEENVEEIPKDGNQEKDIEEKTTDEINNLEGDDTAHSQKDTNEAGKNNKEDNDDLKEDKKRMRKTGRKMRNLIVIKTLQRQVMTRMREKARTTWRKQKTKRKNTK